MKQHRIRFFLVLAFVMIPLNQGTAASIDDFLGRTHLEIQPHFTYRLAYEDNIDYDSSDKITDWSNHYKPGVEVIAIGPQWSLGGTAELDITEYINERDYNYVDQDYSLTLGFLPNDRWEYSIGGGYQVDSNTNRYEGDTLDPDEFERYKDKTKDLFAGATYVINPRSTISLTGTFARYDTITTSQSDFYGALALYTYDLNPATNIIVNGAYFFWDFEGNNRTWDEEGEFFYNYSFYDYEMKNYSLTAGLTHQFDRDTKLGFDAGFRYTDIDTTERDEDKNVIDKSSGNGNGWVASGSFEKRYNEFLFYLSASQDISVSPRGSNYDGTQVSFNTQYDVNRRCTLNLDLRWHRAYADSGDDEFLDVRDTRTYTVKPYVKYRAYRWLQIKVGHYYRYSENKKSDRNSIHSNLFYIDLKFTPTRPLVMR